MRFLFAALLIALLLTTGVHAQSTLQRPAAAQYDVVALMVEFQPDTTRFTSGDGTFGGDLFDGLQPTLDVLPHDAAYFQAHLDFLEDYVRRVSDGRTEVATHVLPGIVRVAQRMGAYSPTGFDADSDEELQKLAALVSEAWTLADAQVDFDMSGFDPQTTAFVLFHAGVGRDLELIGTTLDKTPLDLPSLFFDQNALNRLGQPQVAFKGVPVSNTLVMPRTETRKGFNFITDEDFLAEFSINGLLAASFFNYLGVPDLFDTEDGTSAIGPFGLMDGLGIFAFSGLFPPEPTAWTKYFLGWAEPRVVEASDEPLELLHTSAFGSADMIRVPVSATEYFLVENRNRDPEDDGVTLRIWRDGAITTQTFFNGDTEFNDVNIDAFAGGVVVGVDDYDWALPGGVDENDNILNGGILIWHVDEGRIAETLQTNSVNADPERRGLDLEEADSAQDIGFPSGGAFGPSNDLGSPFDFYYEGNPVVVISRTGREVRLYENRFGADTYPDSDNNAGGPSFVVIDDFSLPGATMTLRVSQTTGEGITPRVDLSYAQLVTPPSWTAPTTILPVGDSQIAFWTRSGRPQLWPEAGPLGNPIILAEETIAPILEDERLVALARTGRDGTVTRYTVEQGNVTTEALTLPSSINVYQFVGPLVAPGDGAQYAVYLNGTQNGVLRFAGSAVTDITPSDVGRVETLAAVDGSLVVLGTTGAVVVGQEIRWSYDRADGIEGQPVFGRDATGLWGVVPGRELLLLLPNGTTQAVDPSVYIENGTEFSKDIYSVYPSLADLDGDFVLDVIVTMAESLVAFSQAGAMIDGFPIAMGTASLAQPLVAQLTDSGTWSILVAGLRGYLDAFDLGNGGRRVPGFPLAVGDQVLATPLLTDEGDLVAVARNGAVKRWSLSNVGEIAWGRLYQNAQNTSFVNLPVPLDLQVPSELLPAADTYNWPNPIRNGETFFRLRPSQASDVTVTIIDAAGSVVDELRAENVPARVPTDLRWTTDAGSGVYYARVTARSADGEEQSRIVKVAIVR